MKFSNLMSGIRLRYRRINHFVHSVEGAQPLAEIPEFLGFFVWLSENQLELAKVNTFQYPKIRQHFAKVFRAGPFAYNIGRRRRGHVHR